MTRLLLQNKLGHLDKISILWKIKGDEKIALAIAVLINSMMELSSLAKKHSLEGELYMGGGLEKVLGVLGESRKRKFLSENTGKTLGKQDLWDRLMEFLSKEQAMRETCALYEKIDKCRGIESTSNRDSNIKSGGQRFGNSVNANTMASGGKLKCYICEKDDHVISTNKRGYTHVQYFACKLFVSMSPKERFKTLSEKDFCCQCLRPGLKQYVKHVCWDRYACPNSSHNNNGRRPHVLVCEAHKTENINKSLLGKYKTNVIDKTPGNFGPFTRNISLPCHSQISELPGSHLPCSNRFSSDDYIQEIKSNQK